MPRRALFHESGVIDDGPNTLDLAALSGLTAHLGDTSDAHDASAISFSPTGTIASTDVQSAIAEVASEAGGGGSPTGSAGGALDGSYPNPGLAASVAGAGLAETSDVLSVNVDGSTIEISSDALRVKADGITANEIAAGAVGASELASTAVTPATYGSASNVGQFTVDADGRITAAADVAITASGVGGIPTDGWISVSGLSYSSVDGPTGVVGTSSDLTGTIGVGARIKFTQTTVKYFIVTAIDASTMTLYGGTDYTLANATISSAYWSPVKAPHGFPLDPAKWTLETTATNQPDKASASAGTWYGGSGLSPTGPSLDIHIGAWDVYWETTAFSQRSTGGSLAVGVSLSTANNTAGDQKLTAYAFANQSSGTVFHQAFTRRSTLTLASKTTYFLNIFTDQASSTHLTLYGSTTLGNIVIRAVCAYL